MLTLKQAFKDLHDRMQKQIAEKIWEIERVKGLKEGTDEWYDFAGPGAIKEKVLAKLKKELKERKENLRVLKKIIKKKEKEDLKKIKEILKKEKWGRIIIGQ